MSGENGKIRKSIWLNFVVLILLLVTTGFTITACTKTKQGGESTKPAGQSTKQQKKKQPAKPAKSDKQKDLPPDKIEETTTDDDPE